MTLLACEQASSPVESVQHKGKQFMMDANPSTDSTFVIWNATHVNLGMVSVRLSDSSLIYISVPDSGRYSGSISATPIHCIINSHSLPFATPVWIGITDHTAVHATWTANIVVIDESEQG